MAITTVEEIDAEIEALKEKRRQKILADRTARQNGEVDAKLALGLEVTMLFDSWTDIDPQLFRLYVEEHKDEIVAACSSEMELYPAIDRLVDYKKERMKEIRDAEKAQRAAEKAARDAEKEARKMAKAAAKAAAHEGEDGLGEKDTAEGISVDTIADADATTDVNESYPSMSPFSSYSGE